MKAFMEVPEVEQIKITVPFYLEEIKEVGSFQFEIIPPASFVCTEIIPSPEFAKIKENAFFLARPNLKGNARIAFAAVPVVKAPDKLKVCDFVFELRKDEVFDINNSWSGVWDLKSKLAVLMIDSTLPIKINE